MAKTLTVLKSGTNIRNAPNLSGAFIPPATVAGEQYQVIGEFFTNEAKKPLIPPIPDGMKYEHWAQIVLPKSASRANYICVKLLNQVDPLCRVDDNTPSTTPTVTVLSPEDERELRGIITLAHQVEALAKHILGE